MLYSFLSFVLDVVVSIVGGACLLRLYMQWRRVPFANPLGALVFRLSDWLVLPLRRLVPPSGQLDQASLAAVLVLELGRFLVLWLVVPRLSTLAALPILALVGLLQLALTVTIGLIIIHAILSWVGGGSAVEPVIARLVAPVLDPIRQRLPLVGGVDLSPIVALLGLQLVSWLLGALVPLALR